MAKTTEEKLDEAASKVLDAKGRVGKLRAANMLVREMTADLVETDRIHALWCELGRRLVQAEVDIEEEARKILADELGMVAP